MIIDKEFFILLINTLIKGETKEFSSFAGGVNAFVAIIFVIIFAIQDVVVRFLNIIEKVVDASLSSKLPNARFSSYKPVNPIHLIICLMIMLILCLTILGSLL